MARNLSNKQKNIYLALMAIMYILIVGAVYEIRAYDTWYLFVATLVWAVIVFFYQKSLEIKFNKEANHYLESIDKKYRFLFYASNGLIGSSIIYSISTNPKFIMFVIIATCYQLYMTKKMLDYVY